MTIALWIAAYFAFAVLFGWGLGTVIWRGTRDEDSRG